MMAAVAFYSDTVSAESPLDVIANAFNELGRVVAIPINAVTGWRLGERDEDMEKESMSGAEAGAAESASRETDAAVSDIREGAAQTANAASTSMSDAASSVESGANDAASSVESGAKDAADSAETGAKDTKERIEHGIEAPKDVSSGHNEESTEDKESKTIADRAAEATDAFLDTSEDVAKHPKESAGNAMSSIGEETAAASDTLAHNANSLAETIEDVAKASKDETAEKVGDAAETVRDAAKGPSEAEKQHLWEDEQFFTS